MEHWTETAKPVLMRFLLALPLSIVQIMASV